MNHILFMKQVMTPLPPHVPQCKALYDFRMTNDDEDGCLTFNKVDRYSRSFFF